MRSHAKAASVVVAVFGLFAFASLTSGAADAAANSCSNALIREEQNSGYLPECRAYEQVSPVEKNGTDIATPNFFTQSATVGDAVAFVSPGAFAGASSLVARASYLATRDPALRWQVKAVDPAQTTGDINRPSYGLQAFSADLSESFMKVGDPQPIGGADLEGNRLVVHNNFSNAYSLVSPVVSPYSAQTGYAGAFADASSDFSHIVFESSSQLTPNASINEPFGGNGRTNLYQYVEGPGGASALHLVDLLPDPDGSGPEEAVAAPEGAVAGGIQGSQAIISGSGATSRTDTKNQNVVSDDGSRVFWTSIAPIGSGERQVYVRIDNAETVRVSASQRSTPEESRDAVFLYATPDGRYVFFTSWEKLTEDSTAGGTQLEPNPDLYRFDVDTRHLDDLTVQAVPAEAADVLGVLGASDDGQTVYFAANGHLASGSEDVPDTSPLGEIRPKLYVSDHGVIRYIATLPGHQEAESAQGLPVSESNWEWASFGSIRPSRVSPDGRYLFFRSSPAVTAAPAANFAQIYRFDHEANPDDALKCVSCHPGGAPNTSTVFLEGDDFDGMLNATAGSVRAPYLANLMLPGGEVLFATAQGLVPRDINEKIDVYLWSEQGGPQLISSGTAPFDSFIADASPDGRNIYLLTRQRLVRADSDANVDLYDARIDGGFAEPPLPPRPCGGEACQGAATMVPVAAGTASAAVNGQGNVARPKSSCGKNAHRVKTNGKARCVKKKHSQKKRHSHKKKHSHTKKHKRKHNRRAATHRSG